MAARDRVSYRAIAAALRERISGGDLGAGGRLPSTRELAATYRVATTTAQRALESLRADGLVVSRPGAGYFVRTWQEITRATPERLAPDWWGSGHTIQTADLGERPLEVATDVTVNVPAPASIAEALGVPVSTPVVERSRRFIVDGRPVSLSRSYIPADIADGTAIANIDSGPGGTFARLAEQGHKPVEGVEIVRGRMPDPADAEALQLSRGTPVQLIERRVYDETGRCVEVNFMTLDATAYALSYRFSL